MGKKLIEVSLPLDVINNASAREKSIRHGHPSTLHLWWARRPLATARAVLFASLVDDPSEHPDKFPTQELQQAERERLFKIIENIVTWENSGNNEIFFDAYLEIVRYLREMIPTKKLIEVALPLDVINNASAREKSIRHGHPSTLHLWWSRKPTATARAVLFASLVDDPSEHPDKFPTQELQQAERERLFKIIGEIVNWENSSDTEIFAEALTEIKNSVGDKLPAVFDPFAGGGSIPLEAQRLGLKSFAADLNPVAVIINKAMIEIPAQFKDKPPINPDSKKLFDYWRGAFGLADDILYYGKLLKKLAQKKIGNLYPKIDDKTVIAWLWARTVTCSNPACKKRLPLVHSFKLSAKQNIFVKPIVDGDNIIFQIADDKHNIPEGTVNRNGAHCLFCGSTVPLAHVRNEGKARRLGAKLMAIVAESKNGRVYLPPNETHEQIANVPMPDDFPDGEISKNPRWFSPPLYGLENFSDLFTNRQLTALTTFSDLISEVQAQVIEDGGNKNYSDAIAVYLSFLIDRLANYNSSFCIWNALREGVAQTFGRQAIPMNWDFPETNPFSNSSGCFDIMLEGIVANVKNLPAKEIGSAFRHSALEKFPLDEKVIVSTDPPYYDNIGYADLSEFFYVWLRQSLKNIYPKLFGRMTFEKDEELIASPYRHENKSAAKNFFEGGMFKALKNIYEIADENFPTTIYYAFKQRDSESDGAASTAWEIMLNAIIRAGFQITATLPIRTERPTGLKYNVNALASSIVLACRKRPPENKICGKSEFIRALKDELKPALEKWQQTTIAPVDMAQAAIGPGIAVYSRYEKITDMNDKELTVRDALKIINAELAEFFGTQTGQLDAASQFCVDIFTQENFGEILFGDADVLARAKNISVGNIEEIGAVKSERGEVRLIRREEMPVLDADKNLNGDWLKKLQASNCAWLWVQSLVAAFKRDGTNGAAKLLAQFEGKVESVKNLAYRLYNVCEKNKWASEGTGYNELVMEWEEILTNISKYKSKSTQLELGI